MLGGLSIYVHVMMSRDDVGSCTCDDVSMAQVLDSGGIEERSEEQSRHSSCTGDRQQTRSTSSDGAEAAVPIGHA